MNIEGLYFIKFAFMRLAITISLMLSVFLVSAFKNSYKDSIMLDLTQTTDSSKGIQENMYKERLRCLDENSPMDLKYNDKVKPFIESYLGKNRSLISRMKGVSPYYFSLFEYMLDKYDLPLELKYLPIVESALNPKATSNSGAKGLWQFMYLTGKEYGLSVTSYIDERQDPFKSTEAACIYLSKLYNIFGDWNLVLAAYNGGPGYINRKIISSGINDFWQLQEHLRKETREYIPTFIAVNYAMNYAEHHDIHIIEPNFLFNNTDTLVLKKQVDAKTLKELLCVNLEVINYLNPSFKKNIYPEGAILTLPKETVDDFLLNEVANYLFIDMVKNKEVLIDEERIVYRVKQGDYLGKIAKQYQVYIFEIKEWNNLKSTKLSIGDELVLFVKKEPENLKEEELKINEYIVQKGDTLWGIARKYKGLSVWKIKSMNNIDSDHIKPGTKLVLPII